MNSHKQKILLIGVGNEERADDGVGIYIARKLKSANLDSVSVIETGGDLYRMMEDWLNYDEVIIIDAAKGGGEPGDMYSFNAVAEPLPRDIFPKFSTHSFTPAEAIELCRQLYGLPPKLTVYGIEGADFSRGKRSLSPAIKASVEELIRQLLEYLPL